MAWRETSGSHFAPSSLELKGTLCRGEQHLPGPTFFPPTILLDSCTVMSKLTRELGSQLAKNREYSPAF
jgi:hypothetical protein